MSPVAKHRAAMSGFRNKLDTPYFRCTPDDLIVLLETVQPCSVSSRICLAEDVVE